MKRFLSIIIIFIGISVQLFSQDNNWISGVVQICSGILGRTVPDGVFERVNRTIYVHNDTGIIIQLDNDIVYSCTSTMVFSSFNEAARHNGLFYDYFEKNGWLFYNTSSTGDDIYHKNGVYANIINPSRREDGSVVVMTIFSKNINMFF